MELPWHSITPVCVCGRRVLLVHQSPSWVCSWASVLSQALPEPEHILALQGLCDLNSCVCVWCVCV